jgi:hypothetical protein
VLATEVGCARCRLRPILASDGSSTGSAMRGLVLGFGLLALVGCTAADDPGEPVAVTLYCYETLADAACYGAPDAGRGNRLLAVVDVPVTREVALRLRLE